VIKEDLAPTFEAITKDILMVVNGIGHIGRCCKFLIFDLTKSRRRNQS